MPLTLQPTSRDANRLAAAAERTVHADPDGPPEPGTWRQICALGRYLSQTDVHTYAFSVAANVILSLFPFIVLLLTLSQQVFHSSNMTGVVGQLMHSFLPTGQDFVMRNMALLAHPKKGAQIFSFVILSRFFLSVLAGLSSMTMFFLIYWILPNRSVPARAVLPAAVVTGLLWEGAKHLYIAALPVLDFQRVYGPFYISVGLMMWAFLSGLILLAGAHFSATRHALRLAAAQRGDGA